MLAVAARGETGGDQRSTIDAKAAVVYNFAKFVEWPGLAPDAPIIICVVGDDRFSTALTGVARGPKIEGHAIEVHAIATPNGHACHMLFISTHAHDAAQALDMVKDGLTLTVGDAGRFAGGGGMIEILDDRDRMRFAINVNAVQRSQLKVSSRLLGLATIVRDEHAR